MWGYEASAFLKWGKNIYNSKQRHSPKSVFKKVFFFIKKESTNFKKLSFG